MQLRNAADRYGAVSILLHWCGVIAVLSMPATAAWAWVAPNHPIAAGRLGIHGALGTVLYALIVLRIVWHFVERQPVRLSDSRALSTVATAVHVTLLVLVALQLVTGPVDIWSGGWSIGVFGWFEIPSPLGTVRKPWHDPIGDVHRYTGFLIAGLVSLHFAAVLKHLLIDRDRTLQRMLGLPMPAHPYAGGRT